MAESPLGQLMLRIHFLPEDLAKTHVVVNPDPLWETVLSLQCLFNGDGRLVFRKWRQRMRGRVPEAVEQILLTLSPPLGSFADFLTPTTGALGLEAALDSVLSTPRSLIRKDLDTLTQSQRLPGWTRALGDGDVDTLGQVTHALRAWHDTGVAPYRTQIQAHVDAETAVRSRLLRHGGIERVLADLPAPLRWQPPVLETPYVDERDLHLNGRGLLLVPSFFCWGKPVTFIDPDMPPTLVYPIQHDLMWMEQGDTPARRGDRELTALLGTTRAAVLYTIAEGPFSTTEVAKRLRISPPSASEHATVLREATLVTTQRHGNMSLHSITPLGVALLDGLLP
jgi:DNA-binding transcriptional ArsR family regulator